MEALQHIRLMAHYNQWMNAKLYAAAAKLSPEELARDRGAFFGSLLGTLNHLAVADIIWLQRLASHPARHRSLEWVRAIETPASLDPIFHHELAGLAASRVRLDAAMIEWTAELSGADLDHVLAYRNMSGAERHKRFGSLVLHLFNHQTHHRGQATTLVCQAGVDVGVTDLLAVIPEES